MHKVTGIPPKIWILEALSNKYGTHIQRDYFVLVFASEIVLTILFGITTKKKGTISARDAYDCIVHSCSPPVANHVDSFLWTKALPVKISCFNWLVLRNKILTWKNLQKRGKFGPGMCALCCSDGETVEHLFSTSSVWKYVAVQICEQYNLPAFPPSDSLWSMIRFWIGNFPRSSHFYLLPFHMMWIIWKARNQAIFKGGKRNIFSIVQQITSSAQVLSSLTVNGLKKKQSAREASL